MLQAQQESSTVERRARATSLVLGTSSKYPDAKPLQPARSAVASVSQSYVGWAAARKGQTWTQWLQSVLFDAFVFVLIPLLIVIAATILLCRPQWLDTLKRSTGAAPACGGVTIPHRQYHLVTEQRPRWPEEAAFFDLFPCKEPDLFRFILPSMRTPERLLNDEKRVASAALAASEFPSYGSRESARVNSATAYLKEAGARPDTIAAAQAGVRGKGAPAVSAGSGHGTGPLASGNIHLDETDLSMMEGRQGRGAGGSPSGSAFDASAVGGAEEAYRAAYHSNCTTTLVSAWFNVGSDDTSPARFEDMRRFLLSAPNPLVLFVEPSAVNDVVAARRAAGYMDRTVVIGMPMVCLPHAGRLSRAATTMCGADFRRSLADTQQPEFNNPLYNVLKWAKPTLVRAAALLPFLADSQRAAPSASPPSATVGGGGTGSGSAGLGEGHWRATYASELSHRRGSASLPFSSGTPPYVGASTDLPLNGISAPIGDLGEELATLPRGWEGRGDGEEEDSGSYSARRLAAGGAAEGGGEGRAVEGAPSAGGKTETDAGETLVPSAAGSTAAAALPSSVAADAAAAEVSRKLAQGQQLPSQPLYRSQATLGAPSSGGKGALSAISSLSGPSSSSASVSGSRRDGTGSRTSAAAGPPALPYVTAPGTSPNDYFLWLDASCPPHMCAERLAGQCLAPHATVDRKKLRLGAVASARQWAEATVEDPSFLTSKKRVLVGGTVFGIGRAHAARMDSAFQSIVDGMIGAGLVDQEQTVFAHLCMRHAALCELYATEGAWENLIARFQAYPAAFPFPPSSHVLAALLNQRPGGGSSLGQRGFDKSRSDGLGQGSGTVWGFDQSKGYASSGTRGSGPFAPATGGGSGLSSKPPQSLADAAGLPPRPWSPFSLPPRAQPQQQQPVTASSGSGKSSPADRSGRGQGQGQGFTRPSNPSSDGSGAGGDEEEGQQDDKDGFTTPLYDRLTGGTQDLADRGRDRGNDRDPVLFTDDQSEFNPSTSGSLVGSGVRVRGENRQQQRQSGFSGLKGDEARQ